MKKAVVIGSGMGGLTSAILLQQQGYEVTVLEQHTRPGGMLHRFFRDGVAYDTGFHYAGSVDAGQPLGQILRHLGVYDDLVFHPLDPDGFDHLQFPDFSFAVPTGWDAYEARLKDTFPHEAAGIGSFLAELREAMRPYGLYRMEPTLDVEQLMEVESRGLIDAIADHVRDPRVASVLCGQAVLYGVPPRDASFGVHALILDHFLRGACSIAGGGDRLAMSLTRKIRRNGGKVRLKTTAARVEVDDMLARAVITSEGERLEADIVVSNLHPRLTLQLLPEEATRKAYRTRVAGNQVGHGHFGVYLEIDGRVPELGNHNVYRHTSWDPGYAYRAIDPTSVGLYFASAPSEHVPEPTSRGVVLMLCPLAWDTVAPFASSYGERPQAYLDLKQSLLDSAITALVSDHPTLAGRIVRAEASTPLTTEHFTRSPHGATYGHLHSTAQMGRYRPSQRTKVRNLVMVGQGVFSPGILGVSLSAYYAVGHLIGLPELLDGLRRA
ncbi:MAG: NAD(P)/FAD-dependent oxidoreductase [Myxococcota bacterium]